MTIDGSKRTNDITRRRLLHRLSKRQSLSTITDSPIRTTFTRTIILNQLVSEVFAKIRLTYNLGQNKMEQQTPILPSPKSSAKAKTRQFSILDLRGVGEGV